MRTGAFQRLGARSYGHIPIEMKQQSELVAELLGETAFDQPSRNTIGKLPRPRLVQWAMLQPPRNLGACAVVPIAAGRGTTRRVVEG